MNSWKPARRHPRRPNRPQPMRLPNWYPRQRRFLRCGNLPTVPSGGAHAANVVVRRANARERTPLEVDRSQRRSRRVGAALEIVPDWRLSPNPKPTAVTLFGARLVRPKNGIASGIGTATCARVLLPSRQARMARTEAKTRAVSDRPTGPSTPSTPALNGRPLFADESTSRGVPGDIEEDAGVRRLVRQARWAPSEN